MGKVFISAAMIVRNEAGHLEACLRSIGGLVDETVVVDTGSTDGTRDIARRCGARLYDFAWRDDFAAARNEALRLARGEWILYIDADERVRPASRDRLYSLLADRSLVGCYVRLHARTGYTPFREMRLFRNDPRIRFEGVIHENIWPGITRYVDEAGGVIGESELILDHVGYDSAQAHKHLRNLPLLLEALARDPDRVYCWYHLGLVHLELGERARAREAWSRALAVVRRSPTRVWSDSLAYVELIRLDLAEGGDVGGLLDEALERFPGHAHLIWLRGQARLRDGRLEEAAAAFEALAGWRMGDHEADDALGYDERLFGVLAHEGLATCHFRLGRYAEAERYFGVAERCEPDRLEYRVKRQLCLKLAGQAASARGASPCVAVREARVGGPIRPDTLPGRRTRRRVICGCMFHREIDVLNWRLRELAAVVDDFVVVESILTHSGKPREPLRPDRRTTFADMAGRLHCFVVDDPPRDPDPWVRERSQREAIWTLGAASLASADDDLVIISDADEVPFPEVVDKVALADFDAPLLVRPHWFNFNWRTYLGAWGPASIRFYTAGFLRDLVAAGRGFEIGTCGVPGREIEGLNGWHASWFGQDELVLDKLASYAHAPEARDLLAAAEGAAGLRRRRASGFEMFGTRRKVDASPRLPVYAHLLPG